MNDIKSIDPLTGKSVVTHTTETPKTAFSVTGTGKDLRTTGPTTPPIQSPADNSPLTDMKPEPPATPVTTEQFAQATGKAVVEVLPTSAEVGLVDDPIIFSRSIEASLEPNWVLNLTLTNEPGDRIRYLLTKRNNDIEDRVSGQVTLAELQQLGAAINDYIDTRNTNKVVVK